MNTLISISNQYLIPRQTLISAVKSGKIPAEKIGRDWFIYDEKPEFKNWLERYRINVEKNRP